MKNEINDGFPQIKDYLSLLESKMYKDMEKFSDSYVVSNKKILGNYMKKWVNDPLHQWSRQWEYPYVLSRIKESIGNSTDHAILDAGSGITFFSFYLNKVYADVRIYCCDQDKGLERKYNAINIKNGSSVKFRQGDLRDLPYDDNMFNLIYCISVLEHTDDYGKIIEEFYRVLVPGGTLIVTFDVSIDGTRDISVEKGKILVDYLKNYFNKRTDIEFDLGSNIDGLDVFTTYRARDIDKRLLPWRLPKLFYKIKSVVKNEKFAVWPPNLTVFCLTLTKKVEI
ncbi:MAG: class I SAM-dependent methyltransferase [Candidatus Delongbacteria bacterium]|nr:class I SAM-dependent methyltransferase [Candidatus Delongbacteria bacterium]